MHHPPRRGMGWGLLLLLTGFPAGCDARITAAPGDVPIDAAAPGDDAPGAPPDVAPFGPWRAPGTIPQASTGASEDDVTLSANALEMIFAIDSANGKDLFYSSRSSTDAAAPWTAAAPVPFNSGQSDETPRLSADDLTLYYASGRAGNGTLDIFAVTRTAPNNTTWGKPQRMTAVSTTNLVEKWFMPCGTDRYIMVQSVGTATGQTDLVEGTLGGPAPAPIVELNSVASETGTFVSPDCLTIYFASARTTPQQIYTSHRVAIGSPWADPSPVTDFPILTGTGNGNQEDPWLSPDGHTFVFASDSAGTKDIYLSTR